MINSTKNIIKYHYTSFSINRKSSGYIARAKPDLISTSPNLSSLFNTIDFSVALTKNFVTPWMLSKIKA